MSHAFFFFRSLLDFTGWRVQGAGEAEIPAANMSSWRRSVDGNQSCSGKRMRSEDWGQPPKEKGDDDVKGWRRGGCREWEGEHGRFTSSCRRSIASPDYSSGACRIQDVSAGLGGKGGDSAFGGFQKLSRRAGSTRAARPGGLLRGWQQKPTMAAGSWHSCHPVVGPCHCGVKHAMALVVLAICAGFAAPAPCPSTNGHLRFGTISYRQVSGYTVTFTIETQWRRSYSSENVFAGSGPDGRAVTGDVVDVPGVRISDSGVAGPVVFQTGDGAEHPLSLTVTHHSLNETEDFLHGYSILQHTYRAPNDGGNDWLASLSGCCRQYGPEFREFFITARVNLALDGQSLRAKSLPVLVITSSPVLHRIRVVANTYTGSTAMAWRIGQGSELGTATMPPKAAADFRDADSCGEGEWEIDPATGLAVLDPATGLKVPKLCSGILSLNGSALGEGCHPLVVQIASIRSVTPYDCIVHVIAHHMEPLRPVFFGGLPLVTEFDAPGIRSPAIPVLNGYAGYQIYFTLSARTTRPGATLADVRSFALPEGAVLVNYTAEGIAGDAVLHVDFKWTPLPAQAQTHFVCFEAIDQPAHGEDVLSSGQHCVRLQVSSSDLAHTRTHTHPHSFRAHYR